MARVVYNRPINKRYFGNRSPSKMEVHDLKNETINCQITKILEAKHAVVFNPDTLAHAHSEGYYNCAYCIGESMR